MIEHLLEHATGLERLALEALWRPETYSGLVELERGAVILRLLRFEGLGQYWLWAVARSSDKHVVRRIVWDRPRDHRPGAISPKLYASEAEIPADLAQQLLDALRSIAVPSFATFDRVGLDGVTFGVEYGNPWRSAHLYWWSGDTEGRVEDWDVLTRWFTRTVATLDLLLPPHRT